MTRLFLFLAAGLAAASAAPLEKNLGRGLVYLRIHALPGDLPGASWEAGHPCVLDLRYTPGGEAAGAALAGWLKGRAAPRAPVFLLANAETGSALLAPVEPPGAIRDVVVLGGAAPGFEPDIPLQIDPGTERKAYEALEKGAPVESLLEAPVDKPRNDEARLEREHLSDSDPDAALPPEDDGDKKAGPPPLIDSALQRAVQLDRALLALKRL